ncbi:MAG: restriction endonuclease subunit S [Deltaproteobacteria bacterium]|jgi:type I restriction enzyme S subunit|nr:restriction endonuclease subunit S [Deltaproteobacteria bacterium]
MSEWIPHNLGELIEVQNGYAFKSKDFDDFNGIPVIKIKNVASGELRMDDIKYYPLTIAGLERFVISKNDILIALTGSHVNQPSSIVGKVARYTNDEISLLNQRVGKIYSLDEKETNEDYIYWFFKQWEVTLELALNAGGSANQANISGKLIKTLELELPPLPEQRAIASVLSSLDDKIDLLHRQNKTLEAMAETLYRQWFVEEAKEDWGKTILGNVVETTSGGTPSRKKMEYYENGIYHWIKSKELTGSFIMETEEKITDEALRNSSAKLLPKNSILIAMYGATVGEYSIISKEMTCNQAICALKPNEQYPYTFLFLLIKNMKEELINIAVGSAQQNISQLLIKQIPIPPPDDKILEFHVKTERIFEKIKKNIKQIQTLKKLRDTLLPKLMSGEVRVKI